MKNPRKPRNPNNLKNPKNLNNPNNQKTELHVRGEDSGTRIDKLVHQHFPTHSRSFYQKLIEEQNILVNHKPAKPSFRVSEGDRIEISIPPSPVSALEPQDIPLNIVYEDRDLVVVNKPPGMVVHPGAGVREGTLVNALLFHCESLSGVGGQTRPGIVHRLDKDTSGLLVVAKNDEAHYHLSKQFSEKTAFREYQALVWGKPQEQGEIETFLNRSKRDRTRFSVAESGKTALTFYQVEKYYDFLSLLQVQLKTGRTHQIRIHLNYIHHPVFGDPQYHGRKKQLNGLSGEGQRRFARQLLALMPRQALHAQKLSFGHPANQEVMIFEAGLPDDFQAVLNKLEEP
jgi:23S rRNA pseudouridine1911/1915/1917 synthase